MQTQFRRLAAIALLVISGCKNSTNSSNTPEFAFVTNGVASFWDIAKVGAEKAGQDLGVNVSVLMPTNGVVDQKQIIEDLLLRGVQGMAVSPVDPQNQIETLNKAAAATHLITADADAPGCKRLCYIGMDNYTAGRMCGKLVKEAVPQGGKVAIFVGRIEQDNAKLRRQGLIDELLDRSADATRFDVPDAVLTNEKYNIVGTFTDQFDHAKAKALVEDVLVSDPDIACMAGLFVYNPPIILEALSRSNKLNQVKVAAFDEAEETLNAIAAGTCHGTIVQNPFEYGYQSIKLLKQIAAGDKSSIPQSGFIDIPAQQIRQDNVAAFQQEMQAKLGK